MHETVRRLATPVAKARLRTDEGAVYETQLRVCARVLGGVLVRPSTAPSTALNTRRSSRSEHGSPLLQPVSW